MKKKVWKREELIEIKTTVLHALYLPNSFSTNVRNRYALVPMVENIFNIDLVEDGSLSNNDDGDDDKDEMLLLLLLLLLFFWLLLFVVVFDMNRLMFVDDKGTYIVAIFELIWNVKDGIPRNAKDASRTISSSVLVLVGGGSIDDGDVVDDSDVVDDGGAAVVVVLFCVLLFKFLNFNIFV